MSAPLQMSQTPDTMQHSRSCPLNDLKNENGQRQAACLGDSGPYLEAMSVGVSTHLQHANKPRPLLKRTWLRPLYVPIVKVAPAKTQCLRSWMYVSLFAQGISGTMAGYSRFIASACENRDLAIGRCPQHVSREIDRDAKSCGGILVLVILPLPLRRSLACPLSHIPRVPLLCEAVVTSIH